MNGEAGAGGIIFDLGGKTVFLCLETLSKNQQRSIMTCSLLQNEPIKATQYHQDHSSWELEASNP